MRESKSKVKEKLRRRLFRERQTRANLILTAVRTRLRERQLQRTAARVEHYNNLARLQNAREYDLDIEEQVPIVDNNTAHKSKASYCDDFCYYFLCCLWCFLVYLLYFKLYSV
jgi:hypothetical protein